MPSKRPSPANIIRVVGAREHNLRDVSIDIPRDDLVVITGLSGSGKSSLAFDTLYAEGQRRYVESLSAYARQFLGQMDKPDVDHIEGLSPAISIDQKTTSRNPRSTVATVTEIYDYLRLLFARVGEPHCPICGRPIAGQSVEQITDQVLALPEGTRFLVLAPLVRGRKGEHRDVLEQIRAEGFTRVAVDGTTYVLDEVPALDKKFSHTIEVVVDRLVMGDDLRRRLSDSLETATRMADGLVRIEEVLRGEGDPALVDLLREVRLPRARGVAARAGAAHLLVQLAPRRLPPVHRASASRRRSTRSWSSTPSARSARARSCRGPTAPPTTTTSCSASSRPSTRSTSTRPGRTCPRPSGPSCSTARAGASGVFLGAGRRKGGSWGWFEGVIPQLRRQHTTSMSQAVRDSVEQFMSLRPCPACGGARLKPESLAVTVVGRNIHEVCLLSVSDALAFFTDIELSDTQAFIGARVIQEIRERLRFLDDVGVGYLTLARAAGTLSGGEAQRIRLATQIGSGLVGVLYILDEPSIGLHQRDNRKLIGTLERLRDQGNTVLVVEHDEEMIRSAGPRGRHGPGRRPARRAGGGPGQRWPTSRPSPRRRPAPSCRAGAR